jgi:hypothetical protein
MQIAQHAQSVSPFGGNESPPRASHLAGPADMKLGDTFDLRQRRIRPPRSRVNDGQRKTNQLTSKKFAGQLFPSRNHGFQDKLRLKA